jgi:AAA+ ATPase superfamily predicted ATPase
MVKPPDLFDRDQEWADLNEFIDVSVPSMALAIVSGRRRLGKSFLLRRLVRERGGIYHMALEEEPAPALQRFADSLAAARGLRSGRLVFRDWAEALEAAAAGPETLLVIDELPYLLGHASGTVIPSALQRLIDLSRDDPSAPRMRIVLCGSALAVMAELLSGQKALRGRALLDMRFRPFGFHDTAAFYGIEDPDVAFRLYATLGGVPGYRDLLAQPSPQTHAELEELVLSTLCNPSHALFNEPDYLLREDPRITDRALYHSVLSAVAAGAGTTSKIATAVGRDSRALQHPLDVLTTSGFLQRDEDALLQRRPVYRVADPIVRFHDLVISPRLTAFEERNAREALEDARPTMMSQIYGPAFEGLAREWVRQHASDDTLGGPPGQSASAAVNDPQGKTQHQLDVVVLAPGESLQSKSAEIRAIGEAKYSERPRDLPDLQRLRRIRTLLVKRGHQAETAKLLIFARSGFTPDLQDEASKRGDVELIDMHRLRHGV